MTLTISDGENSITLKPHRIATQYTYTSKSELGIVYYLTTYPDTIRHDIFAYIKNSDVQTFLSLGVEVTLSVPDPNPYTELTSGTYYIETKEVKAEVKYRNMREVRVVLLKNVVD